MGDVVERGRVRPGGTRATIILGTASIFAGFGAALGGIAMIATHPGYIPDYPPYSAAGTVAGAGIGWALGALLGAGVSEGGRPVGRRVAIAMWALAVAAVVAGVVLWSYWASFLTTRVIAMGELVALRLATIGSALAVAVTLVAASRARTRDADERPPGPVARTLATSGIVTLSTLFVVILASTYAGQRDRLEARTGRAVDTAEGLLVHAKTFRDEHERFPATRKELVQGARLGRPPDLEILRFGEVSDGFCVSVALLGFERGTRADELIVTGIVRAATGSVPTVAEGDVPCEELAEDRPALTEPS